jgi:hypothetical protein
MRKLVLNLSVVMLVLGMNSCTKKDTSLFDEELMA